jgi:hypothetical protein
MYRRSTGKMPVPRRITMPLWHSTTCDACGDKREFISDALALQLDDGTLSLLRHPGESFNCEKHGLTLYHASERARLFQLEFFVCRKCGGETRVVTRARKRGPGVGEPAGWISVKVCVFLAAIGIPIMGFSGRWDWGLFFVTMLLLSPLVDLNERRKHRRQREPEGDPVLPAADAPGCVPVPEPPSSAPCCDAPDLVAVGQWKVTDRVHCRACGKGVLRIAETAIA